MSCWTQTHKRASSDVELELVDLTWSSWALTNVHILPLVAIFSKRGVINVGTSPLVSPSLLPFTNISFFEPPSYQGTLCYGPNLWQLQGAHRPLWGGPFQPFHGPSWKPNCCHDHQYPPSQASSRDLTYRRLARHHKSIGWPIKGSAEPAPAL